MAAMPSKETGLVSNIAAALEKRYPGCWWFKVVGHPFQASGVPDLLVVVEGLLFGLEVKHIKPGESHQHAVDRATPGQRRQISRIKKAGGTADVVTSIDEAIAVIDRRLKSTEET